MTKRTTRSRFLSSGERLTLVLAAALLALGAAACTQEEEIYNARLSPFPQVGGGTPRGEGTATATLNGNTLEVAGAFEQLTVQAGGRGRGGGADEPPPSAAATAVRLHSGPMTAVRGEAFSDLMLEPSTEGENAGTSGTISGSVELTPEQVEMLREGRIYAQVYSEAAPDGHLWGWFLQGGE